MFYSSYVPQVNQEETTNKITKHWLDNNTKQRVCLYQKSHLLTITIHAILHAIQK